MRRDDAIGPLSFMKKLTILNSEWEIRSEDERVKQYFDEVGFKYLDRHIYAHLFEMLTMFDYGSSFTEPVFKVKPTRTMGDMVCLVDLKTRAPHSMEYHIDKKGDISFYRQSTSNGDIDMKPGKYIHLVHNGEFQNPYGQSDFTEGVYQAWWSKQIVVKFMNIYLERYGAPTVIAKYKAGTPTDTEKTQMLSFVRNLSAKSGGVFPDKFDVSLLGGSTGTNPFIEAINIYNLMISRAMLNPDLTGYGGSETTGGSYALGEQQFDAWYMSLELPKKQLVRAINDKIIYPLVLWNFGADAAATTEFCMQTVSESKKAEQAKVYIEAVKSGVTPAVLEGINTMLKSINYPEVTEDDIAKAKPAPHVEVNEVVGDTDKETPDIDGEDEGDSEGDMDDLEKEPEEDMECGPKKKAVEFALSREPDKYEKKYDFVRAMGELEELDETWYKNISEQFASSINAMVDHIKKRRIIEDKRMDLIETLAVPHVSKIKSAFKGMIKQSYAVGDKNAADSIPKKFAIVEQAKALDDVAAWIAALAQMLTDAESAELLKIAQPILIDSIRTGKGLTETMKLLDEAFTAKGYAGLPAHRIENIVRTNTASAWNQAKLDRYASVSNEIQLYEYSAIMDTRTSDLCIALDGKMISKVEAASFNPPNHYQCRSTLIPIFADEDPVSPDKLPATKDTGGSFMELA